MNTPDGLPPLASAKSTRRRFTTTQKRDIVLHRNQAHNSWKEKSYDWVVQEYEILKNNYKIELTREEETQLDFSKRTLRQFASNIFTLTMVADLFHYARHILTDEYYLSEDQYRLLSVNRRASYSYLNETVERGHEFLASAISLLSEIPKRTYRERIEQAYQLRIIDANLAGTMVQLKELRNRTTHENPTVNRDLAVYNNLLTMAAVGFALYELAGCLGRNGTKVNHLDGITIDREYILDYLSGKEWTEEMEPRQKRYAKLVQLRTLRARDRLLKEPIVPAFKICPFLE